MLFVIDRLAGQVVDCFVKFLGQSWLRHVAPPGIRLREGVTGRRQFCSCNQRSSLLLDQPVDRVWDAAGQLELLGHLAL